MKISKSLIAAVAIATASLGTGAYAAPIVTPPQALNLVGTIAFFGNSFDINHMGDTFSDHFTFSISGTPSNIDAIMASISRSATVGLNITGLDLYTGSGQVLASGAAPQSGGIDAWTVATTSALLAGNYYLQVSGMLVSNTSGSYGGTVMLAPVPVPETYGMLLAGLGVVGFLARRRALKEEHRAAMQNGSAAASVFHPPAAIRCAVS